VNRLSLFFSFVLVCFGLFSSCLFLSLFVVESVVVLRGRSNDVNVTPLQLTDRSTSASEREREREQATLHIHTGSL